MRSIYQTVTCFFWIIYYDKMNPTWMEGANESAPLSRGTRTSAYLPIGAAGRTFGTTYFLL